MTVLTSKECLDVPGSVSLPLRRDCVAAIHRGHRSRFPRSGSAVVARTLKKTSQLDARN
jgi:hypothetical protein